MIIHILSLLGCSIMAIVCMVLYIMTSDKMATWGALVFAILTFLVYWNLRIELKEGKDVD